MTGKTVNGTTTTFSYSVDNQLEKVEAQSSAEIASYYYDPFGRRLWKDVAGVRTYFHYNDEGLAGEYNGAGNELRTYGYQPGSPWSTNPLFVQVGGEYYWYQNDHLGTPQKMISANGTVVWSARYDSFGLATVEVETVKNNLRFPGQYFDYETGLHYNWHRFYDPDTGRYISADPIGLDGGINLYAYVQNDPVNWVDPLGLKPGDLFGTLDGAAIDAINYSMPGSVNDMAEYGGYLYKTKDGKYSYAEPVSGTPSSINVADFQCIPNDTEKSGIYHTHPLGKRNSEFIGTDDSFTAGLEGVPIYMGTPRGTVKEHTPGTNGRTLK